MKTLSLIVAVTASFLLASACSEKDRGSEHPSSILDSLDVVAEAFQTCVIQQNSIVVNVSAHRKTDHAVVSGVTVQVLVRVYWWLSCSSPGLSEWFTQRSASAITGPDGTCQILLDFGASDYAEAPYQHVDEVRITN